MRIRIATLGVAAAIVTALMTAQPLPARAETANLLLAQAAPADETAPQVRRRRPRVRIYREDDRGVYPSYNPGPDAVRECTAHYVEEYRPSGTVIVPRMNCFWRRG